MTLTWKESEDEDGRVVGYRVYRKVQGEWLKTGETKSKEYTIGGLDGETDYQFLVTAVDNDGAESLKPDHYTRTFGLTLLSGYAMPQGNSKTLLKPSVYGGLTLEYRIYNIWIFNLYGAAGGSYLTQKGKLESTSSDSMRVIGGWAGGMLSADLGSRLSLNIKCLGGYVRTDLDSKSRQNAYSSVDPGIWGMAELRFYIFPQQYISANGSYMRVMYSGEHLTEYIAGGGLGYCF